MKRSIYIMFACVCAMLFASVPAQAQTTDIQSGDIITISDGSGHYLAVSNNNAITNSNSVTENCYWEVTITGSSYTFKSLVTGTYLRINSSNWGGTYTLALGDVQYFTKQDQKYYTSVQSGWNSTASRYIRYNNDWTTTSASGSASNLTLTLVKRIKRFTAVSPSAGYVKDISTITIIGNADMLSVDGTKIQLVSSDGSTNLTGGNGLNIAISTTNPTQLVITPTEVPAPGTYTLTIEEGAVMAAGDDPFMEATYTWNVDPNMSVAIVHVPGFYSALDNRGYQQVHTVERTMYYTGEEDVLQLLLAEKAFFGYMRWYDYTTDRNITTDWVTAPRGNGGAFEQLTDGNVSWGWYGLNGVHIRENVSGQTGDNDHNTPTIKPWTDGLAHTIACDVSAYTNFDLLEQDGRVLKITEPTLSYRQIFYFKPASEMATRIANLGENEFLEIYNYQSPHTQTVLLTTEYRYALENEVHESELGYFVRNTDGDLLRVGVDIEATWYLNGAAVNNPNHPTKDFLQVAAAAAGTTRTYELIVKADTDKGVTQDIYLAQFNLTSVNATTHGPSTSGITLQVGENSYSVATQTAIEENFQVLAYNDFDFGQTAGSGMQYVNTPLPWEQSTYGFYHNDLEGEKPNENIPYYGEYTFLNNFNKSWASGEAREDFAMFVDGTTEPGLVASLQASNVVVCAQKQMYCSMWLRNPHGSGNLPNFRCNIQGRNRDANGSYSVWENIGTFYIGSLPNNSDWRQVVFPITSQVEYNEVRVQLYNFGTGGNGNDFMLDDLTLFVDKTPMSTYQVEPSALGSHTTVPYTMAVLRVNYAERISEASLYYQIYNLTENGKEPVALKDYLGTGNSTSGWVDVPTSDHTPETNTFASSEAFFHYIHEETATSGQYFVNVDGVWVMYIVHKIEKTPASSGPYPYEPTNYGVRMSYNMVADDKWDEIDADCTMDMLFSVTQSTTFELRNAITDVVLEEFMHHTDDKCANTLYSLDVKITQDMDPEHAGGDEEGLPYADWLKAIIEDGVYAEHTILKDEAADQAFIAHYGYTRDQVTDAINDLRSKNSNVANVEELTDADFANVANKTIVEKLCHDGYLELHTQSVNFYLGAADTARYWVFPIEGTAISTTNPDHVLHDTPEPMYVQVSSYDSDFEMKIFNHELPESHSTALPIVRTLASKVNEEIVIHYEEKTWDAASSQAGDAYLYSTTDETLSEQLGRGVGGQLLQYNCVVDNDLHTITLTVPETTDVEFQIGKEYIVGVTLRDAAGNSTPGTGNNGCPVGTWFFDILLVPDVVEWIGDDDDIWGDDANWQGYADGEEVHHYVPIEGSGVVIPAGKAPKLTVLTVNPQPLHVNYPMSPVCGQVYFASGAMMENQHLLVHEKAFVDMEVPHMTWNSVAMPITGAVAGDMFIPHTNTGTYQGESTESIEPFGVKSFEGSRLSTSAFAFWQSFYNRTVELINENPSKNESAIATSTVAFAPTNSLEEALPVGSGHQLLGFGPDDYTSETLTIRLPKPDTEYSYYHPNGAAGAPVSVDRGENPGKLAFAPVDGGMSITLTNEQASTDEKGNLFMFGNPAMANIDMAQFIADNADVLEGSYYQMTNDSWQASTTWASANGGYLAPMRSVMLKANGTGNTLTVVLKPEHLSVGTTTAVNGIAPRSKAAAKGATPMMVVRADVQGTVAQCIVAANNGANDTYTQSEDALFFSSGVEAEVSDVAATSPVNMYTLSERVPMMVDVRKNIDTIPLAMLVMDSYQTDKMTLTFNLSADWDKDTYFCDSETGEKTLIKDGMELQVALSKNHEARYFIEGPGQMAPDDGVVSSTENLNGEIDVWTYSPNSGSLVVATNDILKSVEVYDLSGRMVAGKELELQYNTTSLSIPTGAYIVKAVLRDNSVHTLSALVK